MTMKMLSVMYILGRDGEGKRLQESSQDFKQRGGINVAPNSGRVSENDYPS